MPCLSLPGICEMAKPSSGVWFLPVVLVLLYGIYVANADYHPGSASQSNSPYTPGELLETPQYTGPKKPTRSLLDASHTYTVDSAYKDRFIIGEHKWPECKKNVYEIADQGICGTCHSAAGASVISNRWCIALAEKRLDHIPEGRRGTFDDQISAYHVAACHAHFPVPEPADDKRCAAGSNILRVFRHAVFTGHVTGGLHNSKDGCLPYPFPTTQVKDLLMTCPDKPGLPPPKCSNADYKKDPPQDPHQIYQQDFRQTDSYWNTDASMITDNSIVERMKSEISTHGPIVASVHFPHELKRGTTLIVNGDDISTRAKGQIPNHVVRIIGWDACDHGKEDKLKGKICWFVANSWGKDAHGNGILMIETGHNLLNIEGSLSAPVIALKGAPCQANDFLSKPIDSAVYIEDGLYLFQGHCTQRLKFTDGTMKRDGPPDFIQRIFVGAPPAVANTHPANAPVKVGSSDVFDPVILDSHGEGVRIFRRGTGAGITPVKYVCRWVFVKDLKPEEPGGLYANGAVVMRFGVSEFRQTSVLAPEKFITVTTMLYVGDGLMAIFGQNDKGELIAGVFGFTKKYSWILEPMLQSKFLESVEPAGVKRGAASEQGGSAKKQKP